MAVSRFKVPRQAGTARRSVTSGEGFLTVVEFCELLRISRSTFYDWRQKGLAPRCVKLPNGKLRIRWVDLEEWLGRAEDVA
jgi:excisionase family DNA binding protein